MGALADSANWPLGTPFAVCVALAGLYALGGRGRKHDWWRAAAFYVGIATIVLALDTPIDAYADRLFWVHMVQHVLLLTVAPPLLVLGRAWPRLWQPLPVPVRRAAARAFALGAPLAHPAVALVLFSATVGAWHVPALYDATLRNDLVHQLEHVSFVVTAIVFWAPVLGVPPLRARLDGPRRCLYLVLAMVPGWILAIVLAFAQTPLYASRAPARRHLGARGSTARGGRDVGARLARVHRRSLLGALRMARPGRRAACAPAGRSTLIREEVRPCSSPVISRAESCPGECRSGCSS